MSHSASPPQVPLIIPLVRFHNAIQFDLPLTSIFYYRRISNQRLLWVFLRWGNLKNYWMRVSPDIDLMIWSKVFFLSFKSMSYLAPAHDQCLVHISDDYWLYRNSFSRFHSRILLLGVLIHTEKLTFLHERSKKRYWKPLVFHAWQRHAWIRAPRVMWWSFSGFKSAISHFK